MNIKITELAEKTFFKIVQNYSDHKSDKFKIQVISTIEMIAQNNYIGSKYKKTTFPKFLVSNQIYLFYIIEKETLYIVLFWDNKRNPVELDIVLSS